MPLHPDGQAPYAPVATMVELFERYRDRGLQTPFNTDVLIRAGVAESLASRTLQALRLLDLVDEEGQPTPQFIDWARAPQNEIKERFASILKSVYAEVFSFADPSTDPPERIRDAFRAYRPRGQQERMVSLFLGLCAYAEIPRRLPAAKPISAVRRPTPTRGASPRRRPSQSGVRGIAAGAGTLPPALAGLLAELPDVGSTWTKQRHDEFLRTFEVVLDFAFPVSGTISRGSDDEREE